MFQPTSRYYNLPVKTFLTPEGLTVSYVQRRRVPQGQALAIQGKIIVQEGDRLDHITDRTLGDSEQFWQICDANNAMNPPDLTAELSQPLRIPMPEI